jgi:hypothetical protein
MTISLSVTLRGGGGHEPNFLIFCELCTFEHKVGVIVDVKLLQLTFVGAIGATQ